MFSTQSLNELDTIHIHNVELDLCPSCNGLALVLS